MKSQIFRYHFWVLIFCFGMINQLKGYECHFQQSFESAFENSQAIVLGTAIEEKSIPDSTKGGNNVSYKEVKFEVEKSWKLIDKKFVWMRIPARRSDNCGYNGVGLRYLIYANQMNDILFIAPLSRTMPIEEAEQDLKKLQEEKLEILSGEFRLLHIRFWGIIAVVSMILVFGFFLYLLNRRSISQ